MLPITKIHQLNSLKCIQQFNFVFQGTKDSIPALTMAIHDEEHYIIHFHAKLSPLQAFSICVATLHALDSSTISGHDVSIPVYHTKSLKLLFEEEVRQLLGAVAENERNMKAKKSIAQYTLDPPFSPIGRV